MANFRSTADYLDSILSLAGETTNGNSKFEARAAHYLNEIHNAIIGGGNEFNIEVDEMWSWALSNQPMFLELQPKYNTGTLALTDGSVSGTFSAAPAISLKDYHFTVDGSDEVYQIISHTAASTAFTIDSIFPNTTVAATAYKAFKLDYELIPTVINIDSYNNKIPFTEATAGTELTATLTAGAYTIANLLVEVNTRMDAAGASAYTTTYNAVTRKFNISSDLAGADNLFKLLGATGTASTIYASALPTLGLGLKDHTGAGNYTSENPLGAISKLSESLKIHNGYRQLNDIDGIDKLRFGKDYPLSTILEGEPTRFTVIKETNDGYYKIRLNRYPKEVRRVEVNYIPTPLDLYDNANSHPLIPRKYSRLIDYGGAAYLMGEKNDNRSQSYFQLAGQLLEAMMKNERRSGERLGRYYGEIIARPDLVDSRRNRLNYGEPEDS